MQENVFNVNATPPVQHNVRDIELSGTYIVKLNGFVLHDYDCDVCSNVRLRPTSEQTKTDIRDDELSVTRSMFVIEGALCEILESVCRRCVIT